MFGNITFYRGNQYNHHNTTVGICVFLKCGSSIVHTAGVPCSSKVCPDWKSWLIRIENTGNSSEQKSFDSSLQLTVNPTVRFIAFPKVNVELYAGCGVCIDICPTDAIFWKDYKVFIENVLSSN